METVTKLLNSRLGMLSETLASNEVALKRCADDSAQCEAECVRLRADIAEIQQALAILAKQ